jgi:hypothetical protein
VYAPVAGVAALQQEGRPESTCSGTVVSIGDIPAGTTVGIEYWGQGFVRPLDGYCRVGEGWRVSADNAQCEWHAVQYARGVAAWLARYGWMVGYVLLFVGGVAVFVSLWTAVEWAVERAKTRRR